jgi:VanZ family protein
LLLLVAYIAVIFWLSLTPHPPRITTGLLAWDKLHHAFAYALLTLLAGWAFVPRFPPGIRPWGLAWTLAALLGGALELLQAWATTNRVGEFGDLLANLVGASAIMALAWSVNQRKRKDLL